MSAGHVNVLLGFWHTTELAQRDIDARVWRGTLREIGSMSHPIKQMLGASS